jgi:hypothetical protein
MAPTFRAAFTTAWEQIPCADRQRILIFWRHGPERSLLSDSDRGKVWPQIQVADLASSSSDHLVDKFGHSVSFSILLVAAPPRLLVSEIARALAQVFRHATREYWPLVSQLIDAPLERWQREEGADATEDEEEDKAAALEAEYLQAYEARIVAILKAWGFEAPDQAAFSVGARQ